MYGRWVHHRGGGSGYVREQVYQRRAGIPEGGMTRNGGHHNMYSWQVGGTHPTEMLCCL